jgi:hypothetical protein
LQNLEKVIPDQPANSTPVHLRQRQIFAHKWIQRWERPFVPGQPEEEWEAKAVAKVEAKLKARMAKEPSA